MMQSDTEPKFCKDCKHFRSPYEHALNLLVICVHPSNMRQPELVQGERRPILENSVLRGPRGACGPDGAMFEAKPTPPPPAPETPPEPKPSTIGSWQIVKSDPPKRGFWDLFRF